MSTTEQFVPTTISRGEFLNAIRPLLSLLNLSPEATFGPLVITTDLITVATVAVEDLSSLQEGRPKGLPAFRDPQGTGLNELSVIVRVEVTA